MFVLTALVAIAVGVLVAGAGLRMFLALLPVWGFVVGFLVGAGAIAALFGDGFLATALGIGAGLAAGIAFAILSRLYWYVGVLLGAGAAGFVIGSALLGAVGVTAGWAVFTGGLVLAVLFVAGALAIDYPVVMMVLATASAGTAIALAGILVLLGKVDPVALGTGEAWRATSGTPFLWFVWVVGTVFGIGAQVATRSRLVLPKERWRPLADGR